MNLLPGTEKEELKRGLKRRSIIIASLIISVAFILGLIMLLPSYLLTLGNLSKITLKNNSGVASDGTSTEQFLNLPAEVDSKLKFLQSNNNNLSVANSLSQIIKYLPAGTKLDSISFGNNQTYQGKDGTVILISGIAMSRDSLVKFSTSLKESKLFSSVDMPVSSLTKDKDLPFSINIFIEN
jgi:hypothetical protein